MARYISTQPHKSYVIFSTHLAMTKHFNARARVWVRGCIMHEAKPSALCNREPIRVHHALKCVVMAKCVLNVLVLSHDL